MTLQPLGTSPEVVHKFFAQASAGKALPPVLISTPWRCGLWRSPQSPEGDLLWGCLLVVRSLCRLSPPTPHSSPFCPLLMGAPFATPWVFLSATLLVCPPAIVGEMVSLATAVRLWTTALWTRLLSGLAARPARQREWPIAAPPPLVQYLRSF